ncbi:hypothetical protein KY362_02785 [Candidatus Woesearchaeota archaeon]|nr:hypothetical protein [Candidatus Woesearchaeota archaeon]
MSDPQTEGQKWAELFGGNKKGGKADYAAYDALKKLQEELKGPPLDEEDERDRFAFWMPTFPYQALRNPGLDGLLSAPYMNPSPSGRQLTGQGVPGYAHLTLPRLSAPISLPANLQQNLPGYGNSTTFAIRHTDKDGTQYNMSVTTGNGKQAESVGKALTALYTLMTGKNDVRVGDYGKGRKDAAKSAGNAYGRTASNSPTSNYWAQAAKSPQSSYGAGRVSGTNSSRSNGGYAPRGGGYALLPIALANGYSRSGVRGYGGRGGYGTRGPSYGGRGGGRGSGKGGGSGGGSGGGK